MSRTDDELKKHFARMEPPDGFVDRVMARLPEQQKVVAMQRRRFVYRWSAIAAAFALATASVGGYHYERERQRRLQREAAKADLVYALQLTGAKLQTVKHKVLKMPEGDL